jgi:glucose/arabinose dehydrogenase
LRRLTIAFTVGAALALLSCGGDDDEDDPASVEDGGPPQSDAPIPVNVELVPVFEGYELELPVDLDPLPGGEAGLGRYLLVEQSGRIKLLDETITPEQARAELEVEFVGDLSGLIDTSANEEGLLSLAFHPDWNDPPLVYVYYTAQDPARGVLSSFHYEGLQLDVASEEVILEIPQPDVQHNGGGLAFGPDGYLYLAIGDGGPPGSGNDEAQNLENLLGKIVRIDVSSGDGYDIPADNPFAGSGEGVREEIFAYGFRNPWRINFDKETGELWVADPGASTYEEINIVEPGGNYGWRIKEGFDCFEADTCDEEGLADPVGGYEAQDGCAIIGGYVYRGEAIEGLQGRYVYANYCQDAPATLLATSVEDAAQATVLLDGLPVIVGFAEDEDGELLLLSFDGSIYRLEPS